MEIRVEYGARAAQLTFPLLPSLTRLGYNTSHSLVGNLVGEGVSLLLGQIRIAGADFRGKLAQAFPSLPPSYPLACIIERDPLLCGNEHRPWPPVALDENRICAVVHFGEQRPKSTLGFGRGYRVHLSHPGGQVFVRNSNQFFGPG